MKHPLTWASPRPMWRGAGQPGLAPGILRFARDDFADQLMGLMSNEPQRIDEFVARPETWRTPPGKVAQPDLAERIPLPAIFREARRKTLFGLPRKAKQALDPNIPVPPEPLKLFQAAHQRHYVATATLACAVPGLPDRRPQGNQEKIGMLVRRLMPAKKDSDFDASQLVEYGWIAGDEPRWQRVAEGEADSLAPGEELFPVFPIAHSEANGIKRKMWGAIIPVSRRDEYVSAPIARTAISLVDGQKAVMAEPVSVQKPNSTQARLSEFRMDVAEPWKAMVQTAYKSVTDIRADNIATLEQKQIQLRERNYQLQAQSWLLLLDFWLYLGRHLPRLQLAMQLDSAAGLTGNERELYDWLKRDISPDFLAAGMREFDSEEDVLPYHSSLAQAIVSASEFESHLEVVDTEYISNLPEGSSDFWPDFHFLLAGIASDGNGDSIEVDGPYKDTAEQLPNADGDNQITAAVGSELDQAGLQAAKIDKLAVLVGRALPTSNEEEARALPFAERLSKVLVETANDGGVFCVRFVHLNEDCGPLHPPTLSKPSERFAMASFFDPDAPAREIKIMLPKDTSAAGLRKHARGTAFVMSDMLCGQVQRAKGLGLIDLIRQVLPWPLHKEIDVGAGGGCKNGSGADIGMICSLSIPIVTLCALILLMIIVTLLDFIFKWVPWLIACFPVPNLKAKGNGP